MSRTERSAFQFDGKFDIPRVRRDASALTIHADTGKLWVVTDDDVRLVEFTSRGEFVCEVELIGVEDVEGLCHVGGNRFLIAEEKKMRISLVEVPPDSKRIDCEGRSLRIDAKAKKNKGLEGISYDFETDTLYAVREGKPPTVYRVHPLLDQEHAETTEWSLDLDGLDDLSDTFFDASTGWLWLISHESQLAAAFDCHGMRVVEVVLKEGHNGLPEDIEQAEGIVRDSDGTLFICSEPNRIYRFRPSP